MARRNPLLRHFERTPTQSKWSMHKWMHYFDVYDAHFRRFRKRKPVVLEFGVQFGGSMRMWQKYFGRGARFYGVDIDPRCQRSDDRRTTVFTGDQADRHFLTEVAEKIRPVDVLIEDGGHFPDQQIATFEVFYPRMSEDGVFLIEDAHTSYWKSWRGGVGAPGTFMDYAKGLTDQLNAYHSRVPALQVDDFTRTTNSIHFYDSIVVFERGRHDRPYARRSGTGRW